MLQLHNVLCPIDFSETSTHALTYATALARWYGAHLEVLHVVPASDSRRSGRAGRRRRIRAAAAQRDARTADSADRTCHRCDGRRQSRVEHGLAGEGRAHHVIVSRASALPADLLVMGTHGRSGFNRLLLGSVTERVIRQVACPVLTVPPAAAAGARARVGFTRILCPIDYSPSALRALHYALDLARHAGGSVTVLHVLEYIDPEEHPEPSPFDPCHQAAAESRRRREQRIEHARERLHALLASEPTTWCAIEESTVVADRAYKAILREAAALHVDLIAMGAQGAGGLELMVYGSTTQHVLRAATCPVLTVKA